MVTSPWTWASAGTVRVGLAIAALLAVAAYVVMAYAATPIAGQGGANLPRTLMRSGNPAADARRVVDALEKARAVKTAVRVFAVDFVFLAAVFVGLSLACDAVGRSWTRLPEGVLRVSPVMAWAAFMGAASDMLEDIAWLRMLVRAEYEPWAWLAAWSTRVKWILVVVIVLFLSSAALLRFTLGERAA